MCWDDKFMTKLVRRGTRNPAQKNISRRRRGKAGQQLFIGSFVRGFSQIMVGKVRRFLLIFLNSNVIINIHSGQRATFTPHGKHGRASHYFEFEVVNE